MLFGTCTTGLHCLLLRLEGVQWYSWEPVGLWQLEKNRMT